MAASATTTLATVRMRLATLIRSEGNPNHAADGRFTSGEGKPVPSITVQNGESGGKYARIIARAEQGETMHRQCAHCSRMASGPYAGKRLGVVVRKDGWSHGACPRCARDWLVDHYTRNRGMSQEMAERRAALTVAGEPIPDELLLPHEKAQPSDTERMRRLAAIRLQLAQVTRGEEWVDAHGNVWIIERGAHGYFQGMYLVSAASGAGHVTLPSGAKAHVGVKGQVSVHEAARMLREKEGLKDEHAPVGKVTDLEHATEKIINTKYNPYQTLDANVVRAAVGDHQLGAALNLLATAQLKEMARSAGVDTKGFANNKAALVTAIVAHVTRDEATGIPRYSGDFGKSGAAKGMGDFDARGLHRKLTPDEALQAAEDYETFYKTHLDQDTGLKTGYGKPLAAFTDPNALWKYAHGDIERVYRLLRSEPGSNKLMLDYIRANPQFADVADRFRRFASFPTAQELTEALDHHFNGDKASWGRNGTGKATPTDHPDLEPYRQALASLRERYAGLMAARPDVAKAHVAAEKAASGRKGGKASGKTLASTNGKNAVERDLFDGARRREGAGHGYKIDMYGNPLSDVNLRAVHQIYGSEQLKDYIYLFRPGTLREKAAEMGIKVSRSMSKADLAKTIAAEWLKNEPHVDGPPSRLDEVLHKYGLDKAPTEQSSGTKAAGAGKANIWETLKPLTPGEHDEFNPLQPWNPFTLHNIYGTEQFRTIVNGSGRTQIRQMMDEIAKRNPDLKLPSRNDIDAMRQFIFSNVTGESLSQRTTLPDTTPYAPTLAAIRATLRSIA